MAEHEVEMACVVRAKDALNRVAEAMQTCLDHGIIITWGNISPGRKGKMEVKEFRATKLLDGLMGF